MKNSIPSGNALCCVLLFALAVVIGCSDTDNPAGPRANPVVGTWKMTQALLLGVIPVTASDTNNVQLILRSDSSYTLTVVVNFQPNTESGSWTSTDSVLTLTSTDGTVRTIDYELSGTTMTAKMKFPYNGLQVDATVTLAKQ